MELLFYHKDIGAALSSKMMRSDLHLRRFWQLGEICWNWGGLSLLVPRPWLSSQQEVMRQWVLGTGVPSSIVTVSCELL